jgi:hypothetical protein
MKSFHKTSITIILLILTFFLIGHPATADDTCAFMVTADDVPPNIIILLDNGAAMEEIEWHPAYDNNFDYTPGVDIINQSDVVENGVASGNGFYNENGYSVFREGNLYYLIDIPANMLVADEFTPFNRLLADDDGQTPTWTINNHKITLPVEPSKVIVDGVIDNANNFRYSKNYMNWLFFSKIYTKDGTDLPNKSRYYYAKKAIMTVAKLVANQAKIGIFNFTSNSIGASNVQPLMMTCQEPLAGVPANNVLDPNFINNINNMGTVNYSPLAEGLAGVGGHFASKSSHVVGYYCQKNFVIVVSPGVSSEDLLNASQSEPGALDDHDKDNLDIGEGNIKEDDFVYSIPINYNGSTYLDDVAHYLYTNDIVGYEKGFQNVMTYTVGFMGDHVSNLFLINTSNNGNGNSNLYQTSHEEYAKYHFVAENPNDLSAVLLSALNAIISKNSSFTAPVVPVTRTTSGNRIYMAFFRPMESNFWEGNLAKFGISDNNEIVDKTGDSATWPNGAIREDAEPYWQIKDWADHSKSNYLFNATRNVYTYLGASTYLTDKTNEFVEGNEVYLPAAVLGNSSHTRAEIINYVRGADVFDEDEDGDISENRDFIIGDILHSEPLVVRYKLSQNTYKTMVYFGANDGMLHAVLDVDSSGTDRGEEIWAFIPPDQLHRLKDMVEGFSHQYYVDSSPKAYFHDVDNDGIVEIDDGDMIVLICGERKGGTSYFALNVTDPLIPQLLWRIDKANSETGILELDPASVWINNNGSFQDGDPIRVYKGSFTWGPEITARAEGGMIDYFLPYESGVAPFQIGQIVGNLTSEVHLDWYNSNRDDPYSRFTPTPFIWGRIASITNSDPDELIPELGESWSEPQFGVVKTFEGDTDGTPVFFIGGGYSSDNSAGKTVLAINVLTGDVVRVFKNDFYTSGMNYSIASNVAVIDADNNGFVDKLYVGDLGGQMWRIGKFADSMGNTLPFPSCDENIMNWRAQILFTSDPSYEKKLYYPPSVTLEHGYDLLFFGTGDREDACNPATSDSYYCIRDSHEDVTFSETDLVNVTDPLAAVPDLDSASSDVDSNYSIDQGWYIQLSSGEKVLAENIVFYKTTYLTTFTPNDDPCLPGGVGKVYALDYKTGGAVLDFDKDGNTERSAQIGGGIPSKPVTVITDAGGIKLFISVGSTNPDPLSEALDAGVIALDPLVPKRNFFYLWWRELIDF